MEHTFVGFLYNPLCWCVFYCSVAWALFWSPRQSALVFGLFSRTKRKKKKNVSTNVFLKIFLLRKLVKLWCLNTPFLWQHIPQPKMEHRRWFWACRRQSSSSRACCHLPYQNLKKNWKKLLIKFHDQLVIKSGKSRMERVEKPKVKKIHFYLIDKKHFAKEWLKVSFL